MNFNQLQKFKNFSDCNDINYNFKNLKSFSNLCNGIKNVSFNDISIKNFLYQLQFKNDLLEYVFELEYTFRNFNPAESFNLFDDATGWSDIITLKQQKEVISLLNDDIIDMVSEL